MSEAGFRGAEATIARLQAYCVWTSIEEDSRKLVRECLYCADYKTGGLVPQPLEQIVHGKEVGAMVHFDFLHLGRSEVAEAVDSRDGYAYVLVIMEDLSGYAWLPPAKACTANFTAQELVTWCIAFGPPKTWVSDTERVSETARYARPQKL